MAMGRARQKLKRHRRSLEGKGPGGEGTIPMSHQTPKRGSWADSRRKALSLSGVLEETAVEAAHDGRLEQLDEDEEEDLVGEHIVRIINSGLVPAFTPTKRSTPQAGVDGLDEHDDDGGFYPLLSSRNLRRLRAYWKALLAAIAQHGGLRKSVKDVFGTAMHIPFLFGGRSAAQTSRRLTPYDPGQLPSPPPPSWPETAISTAVLTVAALVGVAMASYFVIVSACQHITVGALFFSFLLFDFEELRSVCPSFVAKASSIVVVVWHFVEDTIFLGKAYVGREWEGDTMDFTRRPSLKNQRANSCLMTHPPPASTATRHLKARRRGGIVSDSAGDWQCHALDGEHFEEEMKKKMSTDSVKHMAAINFCYVMLRSSARGANAKHVARAREELRRGKRGGRRISTKKVKQSFLSAAIASLIVKKRSGEKRRGGNLMDGGENRRPRFGRSNSDDGMVRSVVNNARKMSESLSQSAREIQVDWFNYDGDDPEDGSRLKTAALPRGHDRNRVKSPMEAFEVVEPVCRPDGSDESQNNRRERPMTEPQGKNRFEEFGITNGRRRTYSESDLIDSPHCDVNESLLHPLEETAQFDQYYDDGESSLSTFGTGSTVDYDGEELDEEDSVYSLPSMSPAASRSKKRKNAAKLGAVGKSLAVGKELNWLDVGTKIGIRILNSEHVQRAIAAPSVDPENLLLKSKSADDGEANKASRAARIIDVHQEVAPPGLNNSNVPTPSIKEREGKPGNVELGNVSQPRDGIFFEDEENTALRKKTETTLARPVHAMWTSATAIVATSGSPSNSVASISDTDDLSSIISDAPVEGSAARCFEGATSSMLSRRLSQQNLLAQDVLPPRSPAPPAVDRKTPSNFDFPVVTREKVEEKQTLKRKKFDTTQRKSAARGEILPDEPAFDPQIRNNSHRRQLSPQSSEVGMEVSVRGNLVPVVSDIERREEETSAPENQKTKHRRQVSPQVSEIGMEVSVRGSLVPVVSNVERREEETSDMRGNESQHDVKLSGNFPQPLQRENSAYSFDALRFLPPSLIVETAGKNGVGPRVKGVCKGDGSTQKTEVKDVPSNRPRDVGLQLSKTANSTSSVKPEATPQAPKSPKRRPVIAAGVKMVVPMFPPHSTFAHPKGGEQRRKDQASGKGHYQMSTVVSSKRIYVRPNRVDDVCHPNSPVKGSKPSSNSPLSYGAFERKWTRQNRTNCVSVTVVLDRSFLRDGKFAEMTLRIMDDWSSRCVPRHSKFPVGSCVATSYGIGILVGWRVEDDCHVIRSLWQPRGAGSALAYLNRSALHGVMEAAVGFRVKTTLGKGTVLAYVHGGAEFRSGRYFVLVKEVGRHKGHVIEFNRCDILSCPAAKFVPVIEQIRESAQYQIQMDTYDAAVLQQKLENNEGVFEDEWSIYSEGFEVVMSSFIKALGESRDFDKEMNIIVTSVINFLERLDEENTETTDSQVSTVVSDSKKIHQPGYGVDISQGRAEVVDGKVGKETVPFQSEADEVSGKGFWILNDLFGGVFKKKPGQEMDSASLVSSSVSSTLSPTSSAVAVIEQQTSESHRRAFAAIRILMRTVAIARSAASQNRPNLHMAFSIIQEGLLFIKTVLKVQEKNMKPKSIHAWKRTFEDIIVTFGPVKERLQRIGKGVADRIERQGHKAKIRALRFVDIVLVDDRLLQALELGDWDQCVERLELAVVKANILDAESCAQYHKTALFVYKTLAPKESRSKSAAKRNEEKFALFAKAIKWMASPRRSLLKLLTRDDVLELVERILVRVFEKDKEACRMLNIFAFNFHSFRHLRLLKNMAISGKLWTPLLDAADKEFSWAVSRMPDNTRDFGEPVSKLFSLGVAKLHKIKGEDLSSNWLDFLTEDNAVKLIQELDMKLILSLEAFCHDVKEVMVVLPYYPSIDDDILNLVDEVDVDKILKEAAEALVDAEGFATFLREKSALVIEKFVDYLPKMSIPVERRELSDGWVLTCRGANGGDLTLSDVNIEKRNLVCKIMGGSNILSPVLRGKGDDAQTIASFNSDRTKSTVAATMSDVDAAVEVSILDNIRDLLKSAESHGCWDGVTAGLSPADSAVGTVLEGVPVTDVLKCGIDLWRNLEIDDDELIEIAIKDVSYQIQLQKNRDEELDGGRAAKQWTPEATGLGYLDPNSAQEDNPEHQQLSLSASTFSMGSFEEFEHLNRKRFNPRKDPTVLYLEMNKLTFHLEKFRFRIEPMERFTIFDPVFDGQATLTIEDVSLKLSVECRKERINKLGTELTVPVLQLHELDVGLGKVKFKFKETGADWCLNRLVAGFSDQITEVVEINLRDQIISQIHLALENLNSYIEVNPDLMLGLLGITIDDLEENIVWV